MRESALKSVVFVGVPRVSVVLRILFSGRENEGELFQVILTLAALHEALDEDVKSVLRTNSRRCDDFIAQPIPLSVLTHTCIPRGLLGAQHPTLSNRL
jgi:hypothetical protein